MSATDLNSPPLLTINAPIGLNLRDESAGITNRSRVQNNAEEVVGLEVPMGNNLTLVGGDINLEGGRLTATGGRIELGGLSQAGTVTFNDNGGLSFPTDVARTDVTLSNGAVINVNGTGGGDIAINARNLRLEAGESGESAIVGGISTDSTDPGAQAGDITINAADNITIDNSIITNQVESEVVGDGGNVTIATDTVSLTNGGQVGAITSGQGNAGSVEITATDSIAIDSEDSQGFPSGIFSQVAPGAVGDGGNVTIATDTVSLTNGGQVNAITSGQGNAGSVEITANDNISIDGEDSQSFPSGIFSQVAPGAVGDGGSVTVTTDTLSVTDGGQVGAITVGQGNAGSVEITANDNISIDGENSQGNPSGAFSQVAPEAEGDGRNVTITTGSLSLTNGGIVSASTFGQGSAGSVEITATDSIAIGGEGSGNPSGAFSQVAPEAEGSGGNVTITTGSLSMTDGGAVNVSTVGQGNAGSVEITATDSIAIGGEGSQGNPSGVGTQVDPGAVGDGGNVTITTDTLSVTDGGQVSAGTFGQGNAGSVEITATDSIAIDGEGSQENPSGVGSVVLPEAEGDGGSVTITTGSLSVTNGGIVSASTFGQGDAGFVEITATDSITIDSEDTQGNPSGIASQVAPEAEGDGGDITITTDTLSVTNGGGVSAGAFGQGNAGSVNINADSLSLDSENARISSSTSSGSGGIVNLSVASTITLENDSFISAQAFENANGGNLTIDAEFIVAFTDGNNDITASAEQGRGGNIEINAESVLGIQEGSLSDMTNDINASSSVSGLDGTVDITTSDINPTEGATELPSNIVAPQQTTQQACQSNREAEAKNGLNIVGKGGVPPAPELPLNSLNPVESDTSTSDIPAPIETSRGKIQPARGIEVTPSGTVKLTAYRTNDAGDRLPEIKPNCEI